MYVYKSSKYDSIDNYKDMQPIPASAITNQ